MGLILSKVDLLIILQKYIPRNSFCEKYLEKGGENKYLNYLNFSLLIGIGLITSPLPFDLGLRI